MEQQIKALTNEELLQLALSEASKNVEWDAISELHRRGSQDIYESVARLCSSQDVRARRVGADILGQLGYETRSFHEEALAILLPMLAQERDPDVLHSIAVALGHRKDTRAIAPLIDIKNHQDPLIRRGVAFALFWHKDEPAIQALLELSRDADSDVRDWATFGLGSMIDVDTPAIRAALLARLSDEDDNIRGEAMVGLALRHDQRAFEVLLQELEAGRFGRYEVEAVSEFADPLLLPALNRLYANWEESRYAVSLNELKAAIARCQPANG